MHTSCHYRLTVVDFMYIIFVMVPKYIIKN